MKTRLQACSGATYGPSGGRKAQNRPKRGTSSHRRKGHHLFKVQRTREMRKSPGCSNSRELVSRCHTSPERQAASSRMQVHLKHGAAVNLRSRVHGGSGWCDGVSTLCVRAENTPWQDIALHRGRVMAEVLRSHCGTTEVWPLEPRGAPNQKHPQSDACYSMPDVLPHLRPKSGAVSVPAIFNRTTAGIARSDVSKASSHGWSEK